MIYYVTVVVSGDYVSSAKAVRKNVTSEENWVFLLLFFTFCNHFWFEVRVWQLGGRYFWS